MKTILRLEHNQPASRYRKGQITATQFHAQNYCLTFWRIGKFTLEEMKESMLNTEKALVGYEANKEFWNELLEYYKRLLSLWEYKRGIK